MKAKLLNLGLILTSLLGYLEWGRGKHEFLFESEWLVLSKIFTDPMLVLHPLTVIPILGQIILFITLLQPKPNKILTYLGMGSIGFLLVFLCFVGIIDLNFRIVLSTLPFLILGFITLRHHRHK